MSFFDFYGGFTVLRKKDLGLISAVLMCSVIAALCVSSAQKKDGEKVRITIDGEIYGEYSLSENRTITMEERLGYNRLIIEKGSAYMAEADCADQYCVAYKPISKSGETIICLPHRLVVEVTGMWDDQQPDVIVP